LQIWNMYDCLHVSYCLIPNRRLIAKPKPKIDLQHNTYSLQQSTYMEDPF
jgi:hypothetical protein